MSRIMTIWLPRWPVQRRLVERPERRRAPLVICRTEPRGVMRVVGWAWARAGVRPPRIPCGQTLAETLAALSLACGSQACRMAEIDHDDPATDRFVLEGIARWCHRFSPITAVEDAQLPECVHVDITNTANLFGGEQCVVRAAVWTLASRGLYARAAVADTPSAAWAAAHHVDQLSSRPWKKSFRGLFPCENLRFSREPSSRHLFREVQQAVCPQPARGDRKRRWVLVPTGLQVAILGSLPVSALQISSDSLDILGELGVATIAQLLRLPRKGLADRLGAKLARRVAEFEGRQCEPLASVVDDSLPRAECRLSAPAGTLDAVQAILEPLVTDCMNALVARGLGLTQLQVRLSAGGMPAGGMMDESAGPPTVVDIGLFRPSASSRHVSDLLQLRLTRAHLPREVESIAVEVISAGNVNCRQQVLFDGTNSDERGTTAGSSARNSSSVDVGMLLDRLAGRLGRSAVFEPRMVADSQPEQTWVAAPPRVSVPSRKNTSRRSRAARAVARPGRLPNLRPIWLAPRPIRVETVSVVPDGPPVWFRVEGVQHQVAEAWGPERIETAWWRGRCIRRDYYVVETESGGRWWLFRDLGGHPSLGRQVGHVSRRSGHGAWFLHGHFA